MIGLSIKYNVSVKCFIEGMTEEQKNNYLNEHANLNYIEWPLLDATQKLTYEYEDDLQNQETSNTLFHYGIATAVFNLLDTNDDFHDNIKTHVI